MHLILVADIHLAESKLESFGVDTHANFNRVLAQIEVHQPDHVVLMGDYSLKAPHRRDVELTCNRLKAIGIPFSLISGNHDESVDVAELQERSGDFKEGECYFKRSFGDRLALFLDTSKAELSARQRSWLRQELSEHKEEALVFMHHPPISMGVPFMDKNHSFKDPQGELFEVMFSRSAPVHVFSGHYHTARSSQVGIHSVHLCPSTYFQLVPSSPEFAVSHAMPGLRHVDLLDGQVRTWIEFLPK